MLDKILADNKKVQDEYWRNVETKYVDKCDQLVIASENMCNQLKSQHALQIENLTNRLLKAEDQATSRLFDAKLEGRKKVTFSGS